MASLKIKVDVSGWDALKAKVASLATRAEHAVAQRAKKDTVPFVPASPNTMLSGPGTRVIGNTIVYGGADVGAPYARFLYYGKLMVDPDTGSAWATKGKTKVVTDKNLVFNTTVHAQAQANWFEASKAQNLDKWLDVAQKEVDKYGPE